MSGAGLTGEALRDIAKASLRMAADGWRSVWSNRPQLCVASSPLAEQ
jgi:hypothetical protein